VSWEPLSRSVVAADGSPWRVSLRWLPQPPRWRGWHLNEQLKDEDANWSEAASGCLDFSEVGGVIVIAVLVAIFVEAERGDERHEWGVVGWRASRRAIDHIARELARGMSIVQVTVPWGTPLLPNA